MDAIQNQTETILTTGIDKGLYFLKDFLENVNQCNSHGSAKTCKDSSLLSFSAPILDSSTETLTKEDI